MTDNPVALGLLFKLEFRNAGVVEERKLENLENSQSKDENQQQPT